MTKQRDEKSRLLLSMFKKCQSSATTTSTCSDLRPAVNHPASPNKQSFSKEGLPNSGSSLNLQEQLVPLLMKLRDQHSTLSDILHGMSPTTNHSRSPITRAINEEAPGTQSWLSSRSSMSTVTDSGSVWFDARSGEDLGAEEYVVLEEPGDEEPSTPSANERIESDSALSRDVADEDEETPIEKSDIPIDRRTRLPQRTAGDEGSLFAVLKKNVGQVSRT